MWPFTPGQVVPVSSPEEANEVARQIEAAHLEVERQAVLAKQADRLKKWESIPPFAKLPCPACGSEEVLPRLVHLWARPVPIVLYGFFPPVTCKPIALPDDAERHKYLRWTCKVCGAPWSTRTQHPMVCEDGRWHWEQPGYHTDPGPEEATGPRADMHEALPKQEVQ